MPSKLSYILSGVLILLIPVLALVHLLFPEGNTLDLNGNSLQLTYYTDWRTFAWQFLLLIIPGVVSLTLLLALPRKKISRVYLIVLGELAIIMLYYAIWMLDKERNVEAHNELAYLIIAISIVGIVFWIRKKSRQTPHEKLAEYKRIIDEIEKEDLPAFFSILMDVDHRVDTMKDADYIDVWKEKLHWQLDLGKEGVGEALKKLANYKKKLQ